MRSDQKLLPPPPRYFRCGFIWWFDNSRGTILTSMAFFPFTSTLSMSAPWKPFDLAKSLILTHVSCKRFAAQSIIAQKLERSLGLVGCVDSCHSESICSTLIGPT